ncbi:HNH endonuclease [Streptomyces sp. NBC_01483]|uniref:HNH endonuclease n=1 Tax=Streptomyces sp. NBC_01483 TaxID=2903883 RepID=UPI002E36CA49|nr:HNH endonuclease [Streptomyces sp. NBC_01483]
MPREPRSKHAKEAEQQRGTTTAKGYGVKWERIRKRYLYAHPWCVLCSKTTTATDHFPESRRALVAKGAKDPDAFSRLHPLCTSCHNKETARHQTGRWAAERVQPRRS